MSNQRYEVGKLVRVTISECPGPLLIKSGSDSEVVVRGEHEAVEDEKGLQVQGHGPLQLFVPQRTHLLLHGLEEAVNIKGISGDIELSQVNGDAVLRGVGRVQVGTVDGDLVVRDSNGPLLVEQVLGDVALRNLNQFEANQVMGDLVVRNVEEDIQIQQVHGDISLRSIGGDVLVERGQRDVNLRNLGGLVRVNNVQGDIRLRGSLAPGKHVLKAQGDIVLRWPAGAPLNLSVTEGMVHNRLQLQDVVEEDGTFAGRIGDGETTLILSAQGRVILKELDDVQWQGGPWQADWDVDMGKEWADFGVEMADLGEQLSEQLGSRISALSSRMEEQFGPESDFAQKMAERAAQKTERAVKRAMREAERARRRASGWTGPSSPASKPKPKSKVSTEEQMKILSMLEKGVISVEEANTLLKALEN